MNTLHVQPLLNRITKSIISCIVVSALLCQNAIYATPLNAPPQTQTITQECMIPDEIGRIVERFQGNGQRHVVCIQDLHCDPTAQHNIARIIRVVSESYGNSVHSICREGAWGDLDLGMLRAIPTRHGMQTRTMETLISDGILTGSEQFCVSSNLRLRGIENETLYKRNRAMLIDALDVKRRAYTGLQLLRKQIAYAQQQTFSAPLKLFRDHVRKYNQGKTSLSAYVHLLASYAGAAHIPLHAYPSFSKYLAVSDQRKKLQPLSVIRAEAQTVEQRLIPLLNNSEVRTLALSKARGSYYSYLAKIIRAKHVLLTYYPALMNYLRFIEAEEAINYIAFLDDERCLRYAIEQSCASKDAARQLVMLEHGVDLLENFVNNRVSPKEAEEVIAQEQTMRGRIADFMQQYAHAIVWHAQLETLSDDMHRCIAAMNEFYGYANKRNDVLVNETLREKEPVSVMVVGGYHADAITQRLRAMGIGYTLIVPTIHDTAHNEQVYEQLIVKQSRQHPAGTGTRGQSLALMSLLQPGETDAATLIGAVAENIRAAELTPAQARQFFVDMQTAQPMLPFTVSDDAVRIGGKTYLFEQPAQPASEVFDNVLTALRQMPQPLEGAAIALLGVLEIVAVVNKRYKPPIPFTTIEDVRAFMELRPVYQPTDASLAAVVGTVQHAFTQRRFELDVKEMPDAYVAFAVGARAPAVSPPAATAPAVPKRRPTAASSVRRGAPPVAVRKPGAASRAGRSVSVQRPAPPAAPAPTPLFMASAVTDELGWFYDTTAFEFTQAEFANTNDRALATQLAPVVGSRVPTSDYLHFLNEQLKNPELYAKLRSGDVFATLTSAELTALDGAVARAKSAIVTETTFVPLQRINRRLLEIAFFRHCPVSRYTQLVNELVAHENRERDSDHETAFGESGDLQKAFIEALPHLEILRSHESLIEKDIRSRTLSYFRDVETTWDQITRALEALRPIYAQLFGREITDTEIMSGRHFPHLSEKWHAKYESAPPTAAPESASPATAPADASALDDEVLPDAMPIHTFDSIVGEVDTLARSSVLAEDFIRDMSRRIEGERTGEWRFRTVASIAVDRPRVLGRGPGYTAVALPAEGEMIVVGDLHGDYAALLEILRATHFVERVNSGEKVHLVCTGDFVDRGKDSVKTTYMLLKLKRYFPNNVFILRGNHEDSMVSESTLHDDLTKTYPRNPNVADLESDMRVLFQDLPLFLVTASGIVVVHGGVPTKFDTVKRKRVVEPDFVEWFDHTTQLLWNDLNDKQPSITESRRSENHDMFVIPTADAMEALKGDDVTRHVRLIVGHGHDTQIFGGGSILMHHSTGKGSRQPFAHFSEVTPGYSVIDLTEQTDRWEDSRVTRVGLNPFEKAELAPERIRRLQAVTAMYGASVFDRLTQLVGATAEPLADIAGLVHTLLPKAFASFTTRGRVEEKLKAALGIREGGDTTLHVIDSDVSIGVVRIGDRWFTSTRDIALMSILDKLTQDTGQNFFAFLRKHEAREYEELQRMGISATMSRDEIVERLTQAHEASLDATGRAGGEQMITLYRAMDAFVAAAGQRNGVIPFETARDVLDAMVDSGFPVAAWESLNTTVAAALEDADIETGQELVIETQGATMANADEKLKRAGADPEIGNQIEHKVVVMRGDIAHFWEKAALDAVERKTDLAAHKAGSLSYLGGTALLTALREGKISDPAARAVLLRLVQQRRVCLSQYLEGSGTLVLFPGVVVSGATLERMRALFGAEYKQDNAGKRVDTYLHALLLFAIHRASQETDDAGITAFQNDMFAQYGFRFAPEKIAELRRLLDDHSLGLEQCVSTEHARACAAAARVRQNCIVGVDLADRLVADENGAVHMVEGAAARGDITTMRVDLVCGTDVFVGTPAAVEGAAGITLQPRVFVEMSRRQQLTHHVMQGMQTLSRVVTTVLGVIATVLDPSTLTEPPPEAMQKNRAQMKALASAA